MGNPSCFLWLIFSYLGVHQGSHLVRKVDRGPASLESTLVVLFKDFGDIFLRRRVHIVQQIGQLKSSLDGATRSLSSEGKHLVGGCVIVCSRDSLLVLAETDRQRLRMTNTKQTGQPSLTITKQHSPASVPSLETLESEGQI